MTSRTKKQHYVPRFYLNNFCDGEEMLWTHDSRRGEAIRTKPENTGFETNIYSPELEDGKRFDEIEEALAKIESDAAPLLSRLIKYENLDEDEKFAVSRFIASMHVRSPAQIRQYSMLEADMNSWASANYVAQEIKKKQANGESTEIEEKAMDYLTAKEPSIMSVDRRVGLKGFIQLEPLAHLIKQMVWTFEISPAEELITSDNPVFWVPRETIPPSPYGFGLAHGQAVIPFPLSPNIMLCVDHTSQRPWGKHLLSRSRAKMANRMRAEHKEHCLFYRTHHEGLHRLGMKYAEPVQQLDTGYEGPTVNVVRKLT